MAPIWVVVADRSKARFFVTKTATGKLQELADLVHPASRLQNRDLDADKGGRAFDSSGTGRHGMTRETSAKDHEAQIFAAEVVAKLEKGRNEQSFERVVLAAAPEFLGLVRDRMSTPLKALVAVQIDRNYTHLNAAELRAALPDRL